MTTTITTDIDSLDLDFCGMALNQPARRTGRMARADRAPRYAVVVCGRRIATRPTFERAVAYAQRVGGSVEVAS
jgi:hypothetical protein